MAEADFKLTVLQAINDVRIKTKLNKAASVDADSDSISKLGYLNDVVEDISDFGNWHEMYKEVIVSVETSVRDYAVSGVVIQSIDEVAISTRQSALRKVEIEEIRSLQRNNHTGAPYHWAVKGVTSEGNPIISFDRWPTASDDGFFKIAYYEKPAMYTTADGDTVIPFSGSVVTAGLLAAVILDESDGEQTPRYKKADEKFMDAKEQAYNRYNGDTGGNTYFRPGTRKR